MKTRINSIDSNQIKFEKQKRIDQITKKMKNQMSVLGIESKHWKIKETKRLKNKNWLVNQIEPI
jgi:hypothetical protein